MTNAPASNVWSVLANATVSSTMDTSTMSAMTVSTPTPTAPSTVNTVTAPAPGVLVAAVLSGAFLAALVTAAINIWLTRRKSREEERNRVRTSFADAFAAYTLTKNSPTPSAAAAPTHPERSASDCPRRSARSRPTSPTTWHGPQPNPRL